MKNMQGDMEKWRRRKKGEEMGNFEKGAGKRRKKYAYK